MNNLPLIHPTAVIHPGAKIGRDVRIGPYSVVADDVVIGDGTMIDAHVKIAEHTELGGKCRVYMGALVGEDPQDHRFVEGTDSRTVIGDEVTIREYVTIHRSPFAGGVTRVGDGTMLMAFVHVAHDCCLGHHVTVANHTAISGHVAIGDMAVLSGYILLHQFCRIGKLAMVGARAIITQDIPPYCMLGENMCVAGPNTIGLRRAGMTPAVRGAVRRAIKTYFFRGLNGSNAIAEIMKSEDARIPEVAEFLEFVKSTSRGIMPGDPELRAMVASHTGEEE